MGVQTHQSSETAARAAREVADIRATASAAAAADQAATEKAAADKAAADKVVADKKAADKAAADKAAADKKAADKAVADKKAAKRSELLARSTVDAYFRAINATNYRTAYDLGGHNFNSSYASFRAGFENTASDEWDITGVSGNRVYLTLTAYNLDCTTQVWRGYYVVTAGELSSAHLTGGRFQPSRYCD